MVFYQIASIYYSWLSIEKEEEEKKFNNLRRLVANHLWARHHRAIISMNWQSVQCVRQVVMLSSEHKMEEIFIFIHKS